MRAAGGDISRQVGTAREVSPAIEDLRARWLAEARAAGRFGEVAALGEDGVVVTAAGASAAFDALRAAGEDDQPRWRP